MESISYGASMVIDSDRLRKFISDSPDKHKADVIIKIDGQSKEFTLKEFARLLGF